MSSKIDNLAKERVTTSKKQNKKQLGRRFKAIVLPPNSGKTLLVETLHQSNSLTKSDNIFVDIDALMSPSTGDKEEVFAEVKTKLIQTYNEYRDFKVIMVTSNPDLVKYLKVDPNETYTYYPSTLLFLKMLAGKGLIQSNSLISNSNSVWDKPPTVPKINNNTGTNSSINFSLTSEIGEIQNGNPKLNGITESQLGKLYDDEMTMLSIVRDSFITKKGSKMYKDLKELLSYIAKDMYRTKV